MPRALCRRAGIIEEQGERMKICKNCGRQTEDDKVRCPYCGYLFEADMDDVLRRMKSNLNNTYRQELAASQPPAPQQGGQPVQPAQEQQPAKPAEDRERFELLTEVAQLKGELKALHGELDRLQATRVQYVAQPVSQQQGGSQPTTVIYAQQPYAAQPYGAPAKGGGAQSAYGQTAAVRKARSGNRIFLSVVSLLLLGLSIGMFFLGWVEFAQGFTFKGIDSIRYILGNGAGSNFDMYLSNTIANADFGANATLANICRNICYYVVRYGIVVYAAFLVLGFPLLFSLFGRISCKGWHRFVAWMSFIVAALLFGVFCWVSGFSSVTIWFMVGGGANFVRCLFLAFYRGKKVNKGGLQ